jgi:thiamine pyrophosphate-dependent acetolactate synthase large subunit-like protein
VKRIDALRIFASERKEELVITGVGAVGRELYKVGHRETNLYKVQMGFVSPMALGLALALPQRKVVVMEGDGSALMGLGAFATIANEAPKNLVLIVFDNGAYEGGGRHPTATSGKTRLEIVARGTGLEKQFICTDLEAFRSSVKEALAHDGPFFILAKVEMLDPDEDIPNHPFDITENTYLFMRALATAGLVPGWVEGVSASHRPQT